MGPGVRRLSPHRGTPASWAVIDAARRHGWWTDTRLGPAPETGEGPDPSTVDRLIEDLGVHRPGPTVLGLLHEALLQPEQRRGGVHYTPADVAHRLVAAALGGANRPDQGPSRVWDPTCGGGSFLLAAADVLHDLGHEPASVITESLWGTDLDPGAVAIADAALRWWAETHGAPGAEPGSHLHTADVFLGGCPVPDGCDVVVGNPPFQGQMRGRSVRTPTRTRELRDLWGEVVGPYTDTAALALAIGARSLRPGGRLAMVLPSSVLAARDAAPARLAATTDARIVGLWVAGEPVFDAEVDVCAVVLEAAPGSSTVRRWGGRDFAALPEARAPQPGRPWAPLAAAALGVPEPSFRSRGTLGTVAAVSAGFRDEYYGLVGHVIEAPEGFDLDQVGGSDGDEAHQGLAPLITTGSIEPGRVTWGLRPVRFAKVAYQRPVVDLRTLHTAGGRASSRVAELAVPKLLVATQTRVGEAAVDERGAWVASTPTVAVVAPADLLWKLAAVVCSPVGSAVAAARTAGTGRATGSIKHSVASVRDLPLPVDDEGWTVGADALRSGRQQEFATAMAAAYEVRDRPELDGWWTARAPWPG